MSSFPCLEVRLKLNENRRRQVTRFQNDKKKKKNFFFFSGDKRRIFYSHPFLPFRHYIYFLDEKKIPPYLFSPSRKKKNLSSSIFSKRKTMKKKTKIHSEKKFIHVCSCKLLLKSSVFALVVANCCAFFNFR